MKNRQISASLRSLLQSFLASVRPMSGDIFRVWGPEIGRDAALVGAGLSVQWGPRFSTSVYYDGVLGRDNYDNHAVSGGFTFRF